MKGGRGGSPWLTLVQPAQGKRRRRFLRGFLLIFMIAAAALLLFKAGEAYCRIDEIIISGMDRLSESDIIAQSGIEKGRSLLLLQSERVEKKLASLPEIFSAEVTKRYPSTVRITVEEREPVAYLLNQNCFWLVDAEGVLFAKESHPAENLPVITGAEPEEISAGGLLGQAKKNEALRIFLESLLRIPLLEPAELHLSDPADLVLYTNDGRRVLLGDSSKMFDKLALLQAFLQESGTGRCLDLRTGDRLVVVSE